ncbi:rCG30573, isoform CRA_a [Rattus norvegicus]|uniref:RCG30573, isoform CRA_a n=1 Tax=Rattus norvegicus TaxID=10116 RepID=A6IUP0_RAT|nr:rCG30573, isoform CRA_a [Rattus norvegicus]
MEKDGRSPPGPQLLGQQEVERSSCGPQTLESWLGVALRGHRTGPREALQPLGPKQQRLEAWAAGKGKVTSLPPGICCLEASPWRPEGSGMKAVKFLSNRPGCSSVLKCLAHTQHLGSTLAPHGYIKPKCCVGFVQEH